jgi:uncharacterized repeat protein (TIGR01451 family)
VDLPSATESSKVDPAVIPAAAAFPATELPRSAGEGTMLSLQVQGPASTAPGQTLTCTVIARNTGSLVLAGAQVELPLPPSARLIASEPPADHLDNPGSRLVWRLGNLERGAERRLKVDLIAGETGELHLCPTASFGVGGGLRTRVIRPPFAVTVSGPETAMVGGRVVWNIQVGNYAPSPLQRVSLICRLSDGLGHEKGSIITTDVPNLAPGQVHPLVLDAQALKPGRQVVSLSATAERGLTAEALAIVKVNELTLTLSPDGPRRARVGEELSYRVKLSNPHGASASGPIRLTQVLPEGLEFVGVSPGGVYNPATWTITWAMDGLPPRQEKEVSFQVRARKMGDWALASTALAEGMAEVRATHAVHVAASPLLTIETTVHDDLTVGGESTCEVRISNPGPLAESVHLRVVLPDNLLAVQASAPTRWQIQGQQVLFEPLDQMRSRVTAVYRIRVRGVREGVGACRVELTAEGLAGPIQRESTCRVRPAATAQ